MKRHDLEYFCSVLPQLSTGYESNKYTSPKIEDQMASPKIFEQNTVTPLAHNPATDGNPGTTTLSSSLSILKKSPKIVRSTRNNVPHHITQFERIPVRIPQRSRYNTVVIRVFLIPPKLKEYLLELLYVEDITVSRPLVSTLVIRDLYKLIKLLRVHHAQLLLSLSRMLDPLLSQMLFLLCVRTLIVTT